MTSILDPPILAIASALKMIWVIGLEEPRPGCDVIDSNHSCQDRPRLVVIDGRAYRRVVCGGRRHRTWRLEPLRLDEAIDWLIRQQNEQTC